MPNYCEAVEVAGIARELIRNYHPALGEAKIVYLFMTNQHLSHN